MDDSRSKRDLTDETSVEPAAAPPHSPIEYSNGTKNGANGHLSRRAFSFEPLHETAENQPAKNQSPQSETAEDRAASDKRSDENDATPVDTAALAEASELLSQQILGETPLVPPRAPLRTRLWLSVTRHYGILLAICTLLLWGATTIRLPGANSDLELGERAPHDVIAPRATTILDREATLERRDEAAALVTPEYDSNLSAQSKSLINLGILLRTARHQALAFQAQTGSTALAPTTLSDATREASHLSTRNGSSSLRATRETATVRLQKVRTQAVQEFNDVLHERGLQKLPVALAIGVLNLAPSRWPFIEVEARNGVRAAYFYRGHVQQIRSDADDDLALAARRIEEQINAPRPTTLPPRGLRTRNDNVALNLTVPEKKLAVALAVTAAHEPNLIVNARKTERAKREARGDVPAVYRTVLAGSVLIEAGTIIDANRWSQLQDLDLVAPSFDPTTTLARLLLCAITVGFAAVYIARTTPSILSSPASLWLLALVPPLIVAVARVLLRVPFGEALLPPLVAFGAMSLAILLNARVGLLCGIITSLLCAMIAREDSTAFAAIMLGAAVGVLAVSDISTRAHLVRATLVLAITGAALAMIAGAMRETPLPALLSPAVFAAGSSAVAVWLAAGFAMFWERPLGITTHLSLLELSSPDEPVMRRMQGEAPGTYTHSLMVAQLSEAAAKAVCANPLLCRVGGLYHDVGKLRRPHCFIENQSGVNVHDRLTPQLSALLIIAHVKDGLELARALRLPRPIHEIIEQHHGTDLVSYFFHRAQQTAQLGLLSGTESAVDEATFRYPGPRPQSKEAAIVMLADAVEASSRALPDLTPEKLEAHIKAMIAKRLQDGELAECELTMRDLSTIERAFAHVLRGALHQRIEYPDPSRDWKNEAARNETTWTSHAMRDPQNQPARRRTSGNTATAIRPTAIAETSAIARNGALKRVANESSGATKAENDTGSDINCGTTRNILRRSGLASVAAHLSHTRSSPNVVPSANVAVNDDEDANTNTSNGNHSQE